MKLITDAARRDRLSGATALILIVSVVAVSAAVQLYGHYRDVHRLRWGMLCQDRSAHYVLGQQLAIAIRTADPLEILDVLEDAKVWPPLHGLLAGITLAIGGIDYRLAVLPSLAAWTASVVLAALLAMRLAPSARPLAGAAAAMFMLFSPAHRVFAADIMLESLGAAMTLAALCSFVRFRQEETIASFRLLAVSLSLLFFTKSNYYVLIAASLVAAVLLANRRRVVATLRRTSPRDVLRELRHPLVLLCAVLAIGAFTVAQTGGRVFHVSGVRISLTRPDNLMTAAYVVLLVRVLLWLFAEGGATRTLRGNVAVLAKWHLLPMAVWFLLPKRLSNFLFYVSPANTPVEGLSYTGKLRFYAERIIDDYHVSLVAATTVGAFLVLAVLSARRWPRGGVAVAVFVALSAALTVLHPHHQSRFVHTWMPAVWCLASAALADAAGCFGRSQRPRVRRLTASVAIVALGFLLWHDRAAALSPGHSPEWGHTRLGACVLDISDAYLDKLVPGQSVAFFATVPMEHQAAWTYAERFGTREPLLVFPFPLQPGAPPDAAAFTVWLARHAPPVIVLVDVDPGSPFDLPTYRFLRAYVELLASQDVFAVTEHVRLPAYGCTITIWRRMSP